MLDYDLYIFDWDGTLMNTTQTIVEATTNACKVLGIGVVSDADALSIIGKSFPNVIADIVPELEDNPALMQKFTYVYEKYLNDHTLDNPLFSHVPEMLEKLTQQNKLLAIATGRSRAMLDDILNGTGLGHYFMISKTADECFSKPHPQMIEEILDFTGVDRSRALMIGDTSHDIEMGHNAGVDVAAVSHGAQEASYLAGFNPLYRMSNITDLYHLLVD